MADNSRPTPEEVREDMEDDAAEQDAIEPTTPIELAMFDGGAVRWQHILAVRARLAGPT